MGSMKERENVESIFMSCVSYVRCSERGLEYETKLIEFSFVRRKKMEKEHNIWFAFFGDIEKKVQSNIRHFKFNLM